MEAVLKVLFDLRKGQLEIRRELLNLEQMIGRVAIHYGWTPRTSEDEGEEEPTDADS